jgi:UDP-glucose-4-epimerase GalE
MTVPRRRILVTGGAGYIGSHVVRRLQEGGYQPVVLDDLSSGRRASVGSVPLHVGSIADRSAVEALLRQENIEAVVHLAGRKSVGESISDPGRYWWSNVVGSLSLIEACVAAGVRGFVFSSSAAVYGTPSRLPIGEDDPTRPENPYGETKLAVERLLHWFAGAHDLRSVSLRYFNAAGASSEADLGEPWDHATNLIPLVLRAASEDAVVDIFGDDYPTDDGTPVRDYIHVVDLADAHALALESLDHLEPAAVLNLGTGRGASVREVIAAAESVTGRSIRSRVVGRRPGDPAAVWADPTRAHAALGWLPRADLGSMIASAWAWHTAERSRSLVG